MRKKHVRFEVFEMKNNYKFIINTWIKEHKAESEKERLSLQEPDRDFGIKERII